MLLLLLLQGCTPDFDDVWKVKDLRILAIQADPPEVLLHVQSSTSIPPVTVRALVVDPRISADQQLDWELWACTPEARTCDQASTHIQVHRGRSRLDQIQTSFQLTPDLLADALRRDQYRGFGGVPVKVQLNVWPKGEAVPVLGMKRLVYAFHESPLGQSPATGTLSGPCRPRTTSPCDEGLVCDGDGICRKIPNRNPRLTRLLAGREPIVDGWSVLAGSRITLWPETSEQDLEPYWVFTFDGGTLALKEYLSYAYFVTTGRLSSPTTGGEPSPFVDLRSNISSRWVPLTAGQTNVWVVARDDRGGTGWISVPLEVLPAFKSAAP